MWEKILDRIIYVLKVSIIIMSLIAFGAVFNYYLVHYNNYLCAKPYINYNIEQDTKYFDITKEQAIQLASETVELRYFTLNFTEDLGKNILGNCNIYTSHINVLNSLNGYQLLPVLVHEMVHSKYYTLNERFTEFTTFKLMYESDNEIVHNAGILYAKEICSNYIEGYDCS